MSPEIEGKGDKSRALVIVDRNRDKIIHRPLKARYVFLQAELALGLGPDGTGMNIGSRGPVADCEDAPRVGVGFEPATFVFPDELSGGRVHGMVTG